MDGIEFCKRTTSSEFACHPKQQRDFTTRIIRTSSRKGCRLPTKSHAGTKVINSSTNFRLLNEERIRNRVNTLSVVATLTFAAGFTMPGGYNDSAPHEGMAILLAKHMFQVFVICNTIAMYSAFLAVVCLIWARLGDLNLVYTALSLALPLLAIANTMMCLAFLAGVYMVISNLHWLAYVVLILGILFIFTLLVVSTPLFFRTTSRFRIPRYITYYLFCMEVLAPRSGINNEQEED